MEEKEKRLLCHSLLTEEPRMEALICRIFEEEDFRQIREHKTGEGVIGGKACGLALARKLVRMLLPEWETRLADIRSWYVGTEVYCQVKQGRPLDKFREDFARILDYLGENGDSPLIVRSSSVMEDGFENSFFGKYESVFCANQGNQEERLEELLAAVQKVYDSVENPEAADYRRKWHRDGSREQMALLIQNAAGSRVGNWFFPAAAGMGCSYNPYKWMEHLNPEAGMLRVVMGLGTRAVTRTPGDYPRLVGLDCAGGSIWGTSAERHKFSQRMADVIDMEKKEVCTLPLEQLLDKLPEPYRNLELNRDREAEERLRQRRIYRKIWFADCQGLVEKRDFIRMMKQLLKKLEEVYGQPVDIEFAVTADKEQDWRVTLLQCRPLRMDPSEHIRIPRGVDEEFLFDVRRTSMRRSRIQKLDYIVWTDPQKYYECPYRKKPETGRIIRDINEYLGKREASALLLVPGRIGTSSPELGVPLVYGDISSFDAICEVAYSEAGYRPELSYGSHMFQNLVEADVYYGAINENSKTRIYRPRMLEQYPQVPPEAYTAAEGEALETVRVFDVREYRASLLLDAAEGRAVCRIQGRNEKKEK